MALEFGNQSKSYLSRLVRESLNNFKAASLAVQNWDS